MSVPDINSLFEKEIQNSISTINLKQQEIIIIAISGGQDSMAMLDGLHRLSIKYNFKIHGAHLNHQLRGVDSLNDAEFVKKCFQQLNIPYTVESIDVSQYRIDKKLSMEEAARKLRYDFLSKVAIKSEAKIIALGHTFDDQVETILMNIMRGSGLNGLKGMKVLTTREINSKDFTLFRPLLNIERSQTLEYCKLNNLQVRIDESNTNTDITRNRIRIELIPYLQTFNPSIKNALVKLSKISSNVLDEANHNVKKAFNNIVSINTNHFSINIDKFNLQTEYIKIEILMQIIKSLRGNLRGLEYSDYYDLMSLIENAKIGSKKNNRGFYCLISYGEAFLFKHDTDINTMPTIKGSHKLKIPGELHLGTWKIKTKLIDIPDNSNPNSLKYLQKSPYSETFDISLLETDLYVRTRKSGDKFVPLGMNHVKRLKDFMIDSKIPSHHRDRIPLVCSNAEIIWVVGCRISNWAKIKKPNTKAIQINFESI